MFDDDGVAGIVPTDADEGDRRHRADAALPRLDATPLSELADEGHEAVADGDVGDAGVGGNRGGGTHADAGPPGGGPGADGDAVVGFEDEGVAGDDAVGLLEVDAAGVAAEVRGGDAD